MVRLAADGETLDVISPVRAVVLPARIVEPRLARFTALADATRRAWIIRPRDRVRRWDGTCPAWCRHKVDYPDAPHTNERLTHTSEPVVIVPPAPRAGTEFHDGSMAVTHFEVSVYASLEPGARARVQLGRRGWQYNANGEEVFELSRLAWLYASDAREMAAALLAAADLIDPDGEFEAAR